MWHKDFRLGYCVKRDKSRSLSGHLDYLKNTAIWQKSGHCFNLYIFQSEAFSFLRWNYLALHCQKMLPVPIHNSILPALEKKNQETVTIALSSQAHVGSRQGTMCWCLPTDQFYLSSLMRGSLEMIMLHGEA